MKGYGFSCDGPGCKTFVTTQTSSPPEEWIRVTLPHSNGANPDDYQKDLCSDKCMMILGRERGRVNGSVPVYGEGKKRESGVPSDLADYLLSKGYRRAQFGGVSRGHTKHVSNPVPGCPICQFQTEAD